MFQWISQLDLYHYETFDLDGHDPTWPIALIILNTMNELGSGFNTSNHITMHIHSFT